MGNGLGDLFGGNNALLSLLPMLLGSKGGNVDITKLLSALNSSSNHPLAALGGIKGESSDGDYPPLFGGKPADMPDLGMLAPLLGGLGKSASSPVSSAPVARQKEEYPYELQYNRPKKVD